MSTIECGLSDEIQRTALPMLLAFTPPNSIRDLQNRCHPEFLPNLKTARSPTGFDATADENSPWHALEDVPSSRRLSLPGLGSEFWQHSRAHIYAGALPPSMPSSIVEFACLRNQCDHQVFFRYLFDQLRPFDTGPYAGLQWNNVGVLNDSLQSVLLRIPLHTTFSTWQNEEPIHGQPPVKFHGTREVNLPGVLTQGLHSSAISHGVTGLWVNSSLQNALTWNQSALDASPGLALEVAHDPDLCRQNRDIMGHGAGRDTRFCIQLQNHQRLPSVRVVALIVAMPTRVRWAWFTQYLQMLPVMFRYVLSLPLGHSLHESKLDEVCRQFHRLTAFRLAYGSQAHAMKSQFGGPFEMVYSGIVHISIALTRFLWIAQLESVPHRTKAFPSFRMSQLPHPIRLFLVQKWPELHSWTNWDSIDDCSMLEWQLGPMIHVSPWLPVQHVQKDLLSTTVVYTACPGPTFLQKHLDVYVF